MNVPTCYAVRTVSRYRCLSWVSSKSPTARSQHGGTTSTLPSLAPSAVSKPTSRVGRATQLNRARSGAGPGVSGTCRGDLCAADGPLGFQRSRQQPRNYETLRIFARYWRARILLTVFHPAQITYILVLHVAGKSERRNARARFICAKKMSNFPVLYFSKVADTLIVLPEQLCSVF